MSRKRQERSLRREIVKERKKWEEKIDNDIFSHSFYENLLERLGYLIERTSDLDLIKIEDYIEIKDIINGAEKYMPESDNFEFMLRMCRRDCETLFSCLEKLSFMDTFWYRFKNRIQTLGTRIKSILSFGLPCSK